MKVSRSQRMKASKSCNRASEGEEVSREGRLEGDKQRCGLQRSTWTDRPRSLSRTAHTYIRTVHCRFRLRVPFQYWVPQAGWPGCMHPPEACPRDGLRRRGLSERNYEVVVLTGRKRGSRWKMKE